METEKMIEEMASLCCGDDVGCTQCFEDYNRVMGTKTKDKAEHCQVYYYAKKLYNAGYRKIPEGAVVLTREELWERDERLKRFETQIAEVIARKETARDIYLQAKTIVDNTKWMVQGREYLHIDVLKELAKQFGVEIEG